MMMSENKRLTTLQGKVAICDGVVNTEIKKGLLLSLSVKSFKIGEYLAKLQARTWLSRAHCAPGYYIDKSRRQCMTQSTFRPELCRFQFLYWHIQQ